MAAAANPTLANRSDPLKSPEPQVFLQTVVTWFPAQDGERRAVGPLPALRQVQLVETDPHRLRHPSQTVQNCGGDPRMKT